MPEEDLNTYSVDVHVDVDEWARIYSRTWEHYQDTGHPVAAFRAAVDEVLTLEPTVIVCGDEKGPWDIDGIPLPEVDDD